MAIKLTVEQCFLHSNEVQNQFEYQFIFSQASFPDQQESRRKTFPVEQQNFDAVYFKLPE